VHATGLTGRACGKAILIGEHFVVHGAPAIAVPIRGRAVAITTRASGCFTVAGNVDPAAVAALRAMVDSLGLDPDALALEVDATLPLAAGLGGSAAVAVALVRSLGVRAVEDVHRLAHQLEHLAHGNPSGIDDAVVSHEVPMRFQRVSGAIQMDRLESPIPDLWVATVPRTRPTKEAVAHVATKALAEPVAFAGLLASVGAASEAVAKALRDVDHEAIARAMNATELMLEALGVVDPRHLTLIAAARAAGALGAKMTGAGFGGAMLALAPPGLDLGPVLRSAGASDVFFTGDLG